MHNSDQYRHSALRAIVKDIPVEFWDDCRPAFRQAYSDVFQQVASDPNLVDEQRILKLGQDRHFRMESVLFALAKKHDIPASTTLLAQNSYQYVYVAGDSVGFTQSYVPDLESLPHPAKYWQRMAGMTGVTRLDLGDEPSGITGVRAYYGLLTHNPIGRKFDEGQQKLGMVQFSIPYKDSKGWAAQFALEEIVAEYPPVTKESAIGRDPVLKRDQRNKEGQ